MLIKDVYELYDNYYKSSIVSERLMANGLLEILDLYKNSNKDEIFEEVKLSILSEEYYNLMSSLWKDLGIQKYKFNSLAAKKCIINYATIEDILKELKSFRGERTLENYINFIKESNLRGRVRKTDLISVYNLEKL